MSISTELREAAMGPTPAGPVVASSWIGMHTDAHFWVLGFCGNPPQVLPDMTDYQRRMYLLFLSYAAEDEGK